MGGVESCGLFEVVERKSHGAASLFAEPGRADDLELAQLLPRRVLSDSARHFTPLLHPPHPQSSAIAREKAIHAIRRMLG